MSYSQLASIAQSSTTVHPPDTVLPLHSSLEPLQYWVVFCSWASAPQSVLVQEYAVVTSQGYVDGRYRLVEVSQQIPLVQSGGSQLPVVQPYGQFVHHAFDVSNSQMSLVPHGSITVQVVSHWRLPVPHVSDVPVQKRY